ncbi:MAG: hypothetical protein JSW61_13740 [Candidatus Thorarchaeota archaeon]|nr:MAG: hypothetical protein JSW61_13740 [Candidatus Thorarchaeota archaeon]
MQLPNLEPRDAFGAAYFVINLVATTFFTGVLFSLCAALLLTTPHAHARLSHEGESRVLPLISRLLLLFLMTTVFLIIMTVVALSTTPLMFPQAGSGSLLVYLPSVITAVLPVSWVMCSIAAFAALMVDDWRFATGIGSTVFVVIGLVFGFTPWQVLHGETSLFTPYHLFRFLAIILSGHHFLSPQEMAMRVGLVTDMAALLMPVFILLVVSLLSYLGSVLAYRRNHERWNLEDLSGEQMQSHSTHELQAAMAGKLKKARVGLKQQRQAVVIAVILLIALLPLLSQSYIEQGEDDADIILYESPSGGLTVYLNEWLFGAFEVPSAPGGMQNSLSVQSTIVNWGGCPYVLEATVGFTQMDIESFRALDDAQRTSAIGVTFHNIDRDKPTAGGGYSTIGDDSGMFVWALQYTAFPNATVYQLTVSIIVILGATLP